jgi:hypothetical protein
VHSEYDDRLTDAYNNLVSLDEVIKELKIKYNSFIRTRQAATQSYEGYTIPIRQYRTRLFAAQRKLEGVMAKQGRVIETMAANELDRRRKRLEDYQIKARFALAESYDRATKAQLDEEIERQRQAQNPQVDPAEQPKEQPQEEPLQEEVDDKQPEDGAGEAAGESENSGSEDSDRRSTFKQQLLGQ